MTLRRFPDAVVPLLPVVHAHVAEHRGAAEIADQLTERPAAEEKEDHWKNAQHLQPRPALPSHVSGGAAQEKKGQQGSARRIEQGAATAARSDTGLGEYASPGDTFAKGSAGSDRWAVLIDDHARVVDERLTPCA